ncbi:MAG: nickel pincer cofactor biosynthesis protein LarB [Candidatus Diapherotrites archaeon]|uniref:Nickel pincer cofactor biosynthesis protein LarB n=1 Tax=Candidatus Iainarchaeum sp. TaxID=3101447 RepID=A0A8T4KY96_9ARCH|nr:nickel pincer cofactor biosynthesis protein LarB [Candidatus Diapherotrites archaeon]
MDQDDIRKILKELRGKRLSIGSAMQKLKVLPFEDLGFAKIDTHRSIRRGFPEVILCSGKTEKQILGIIRKCDCFVATKASRGIFEEIRRFRKDAEFNEDAKMVFSKQKRRIRKREKILVVSAGTSDIPIAEEAALTAELMGNRVERLYDVGVAGIHRLFGNKEKFFKANVIVVVAGMEGALASIVSGITDKPIIAVPTSVGYGASFKGIAPLLTMLNSCSPGIAVVNIDNGFGAGYMAGLINR